MSDVELIDFTIPCGSGHLLHLPAVPGLGKGGRDAVWLQLHTLYSQYGLLYQVTVGEVEEGSENLYYAYIRFYSARATSRARAATAAGQVMLAGQALIVSKLTGGGTGGLPLPRHKCETLANHYLGFSGWSSRILYHRREVDEEDPLAVKFVSVVRLEFRSGLSCEGAGLRQEVLTEASDNSSLIVSTAKRSLGEAFISAWTKVLLVVVEGRKVSVEIDTTRADAFFYDPTWDNPVVQVAEAQYEDGCDAQSDTDKGETE